MSTPTQPAMAAARELFPMAAASPSVGTNRMQLHNAALIIDGRFAALRAELAAAKETITGQVNQIANQSREIEALRSMPAELLDINAIWDQRDKAVQELAQLRAEIAAKGEALDHANARWQASSFREQQDIIDRLREQLAQAEEERDFCLAATDATEWIRINQMSAAEVKKELLENGYTEERLNAGLAKIRAKMEAALSSNAANKGENVPESLNESAQNYDDTNANGR